MTNEDREWISYHKNREASLVKKDRRYKRLGEKILSFGGDCVVWPDEEPDLSNILTRGELWIGKPILKKGRPCSCHENAAAYYRKHPSTCNIVTGYALSKQDTGWRQHSWIWSVSDGTVIETTEPRTAYFGFFMTNREAREFLKHN